MGPFTVTVQAGSVPWHEPLHPSNPEALSGVALNVTLAPKVAISEHTAPQSIPVPDATTVPLPVPVTPAVTG